MHDEQSSGGQRPDPWAAWSANADPPGQQDGGDQPGQQAVPGSGQPADAQPGSFTQPIGYPQAGQPENSGFGLPGSAPPPPPPGFGQPGSFTQPIGYPQQGQYGQPGGPGQPGYGPYQPYATPLGGYGYAGPTRRRRRVSNAIAYLAVAIVAAVVGGLFVYVSTSHNSNPPTANAGNNGTNPSGGGNTNPYGLPNNGTGNGGGAQGNPHISRGTKQRVENAVMPGLVIISSSLSYQDDAAFATGMVISSNGLVLTNNHVINGTTGLTARLVNSDGQSTGKRYVARWLGYDKTSDVAVIQLVGASGLATVPLGNSGNVKVGDGVVAMGNANGTGNISTVTGSITGLHEQITASDNGASPEKLTNMIQTSSDIIPGDSGGPLSTVNGQVIGMDTAASTDTLGLGSQQNVGFAIPINRAMTIARQIISGKSSSTVRIGSVGFLGVVVTGGAGNKDSALTSPSAQRQQEEKNEQQTGGFGGFGGQPSAGCLTNDNVASVPTSIAPVGSGTLILGALCNTPAATVGMTPGDVITSVNGKTVSSPASLVTVLSVLKAGQTVKVVWVTPSGSTVDRTMMLAAAPPS
jgi:S1-C subfamily serine protease